MTAVDVWTAPLDVGPPTLELLVASLSAAERARAARFRFPDDARRFSAARGWLRHVLGAELDTSPARVPLTDGSGKPRLRGRPGPCCNLSHARELALIAVADREVGVDVEHADAGVRALEVATVAFTPTEAAALGRLAPADRADAFLCRWTAKEAYLKARGLGLALPPGLVEVGTAPGGAASPVRVTGAAEPSRWWVRQLRPAPGYVGAVAAEGPGWDVRLRPATEVLLDAVAGGVGP